MVPLEQKVVKDVCRLNKVPVKRKFLKTFNFCMKKARKIREIAVNRLLLTVS